MALQHEMTEALTAGFPGFLIQPSQPRVWPMLGAKGIRRSPATKRELDAMRPLPATWPSRTTSDGTLTKPRDDATGTAFAKTPKGSSAFHRNYLAEVRCPHEISARRPGNVAGHLTESPGDLETRSTPKSKHEHAPLQRCTKNSYMTKTACNQLVSPNTGV